MINFENARKCLRVLREDGKRDSEQVVHLWVICLSHAPSKLGDELWPVYEQVFIASLDTGSYEIAADCLGALSHKFPHSARVERLQGIYYEYNEKFESARKIYEKMLKDDPCNMAVKKRLISILKAEGKQMLAINELIAYLKDYQSDSEAWSELCDMYLDEMDYKKAAFCMEEVLLSNPHNHLFHQKYAEIKYSEDSTAENYEIAKKYFAKAVSLNPNNLRALHGLCLTASHLSQNTRSSVQIRRGHVDCVEWCKTQISKIYEQSAQNSMIEGGSKHALLNGDTNSYSSNGAGGFMTDDIVEYFSNQMRLDGAELNSYGVSGNTASGDVRHRKKHGHHEYILDSMRVVRSEMDDQDNASLQRQVDDDGVTYYTQAASSTSSHRVTNNINDKKYSSIIGNNNNCSESLNGSSIMENASSLPQTSVASSYNSRQQYREGDDESYTNSSTHSSSCDDSEIDEDDEESSLDELRKKDTVVVDSSKTTARY